MSKAELLDEISLSSVIDDDDIGMIKGKLAELPENSSNAESSAFISAIREMLIWRHSELAAINDLHNQVIDQLDLIKSDWRGYAVEYFD